MLQQTLSDWYAPGDDSVRLGCVQFLLEHCRVDKHATLDEIAMAFAELGFKVRPDQWWVRRAYGVRWREHTRFNTQRRLE